VKDLKIYFSAKSDLGLKRKINEDSFLADSQLGLFVVLDGIGGHQGGEIASELGRNTIQKTILKFRHNKNYRINSSDNQYLSAEAYILMESIIQANQAIYQTSRKKTEYAGMGTTVASLLLGEKIVAIAHVGDSRIYLIRGDSIERLTEDHSLIMEQIKQGIISGKEAKNSAMKNVITQALGVEEELIPTVNEIIPFDNDLFLLCTDGLTDLVYDEEILEIILKYRPNLDQVSQALIDRANEKGGIDNITTILVNVKINSQKKLFKSLFSIFNRFFPVQFE